MIALSGRSRQLFPYPETRGWYYVLAWGHRLAGLLMVVFAGLHIYTLSFLSDPAVYAGKMTTYGVPLFLFLEWLLSLPVIFHALNGGRLILFETFQMRKDDVVTRWVLALCAAYALMLGVLMRLGDQRVSAFFYWFVAASLALTITSILVKRIRETAHAGSWKLQRVTGAFLLVMVPSHFLFMHLNHTVARDPEQVLARLQSPLIRLLDVTLLLALLYHGWYGLVSITADYLPGRRFRRVAAAALAAPMVALAWVGVGLLF